MRIIAANHADALRRPTRDDTPEGLLIATIGGALRALLDEAADELPRAWIARATELDGPAGDRLSIT